MTSRAFPLALLPLLAAPGCRAEPPPASPVAVAVVDLGAGSPAGTDSTRTAPGASGAAPTSPQPAPAELAPPAAEPAPPAAGPAPPAARPASPHAADPLSGSVFLADDSEETREGFVLGTAAADRTGGSTGTGQGTTTGPGKLPPEVIRRVVQRHVGRIHACYNKALANDPMLEGRVTVRFTIGKDGSVTQVQDVASRMKDMEVVSCVQAVFKTMTFPQPEGGAVTTTHSVKFMNPEAP
ncbi:AgmX/PglI C-terminal domain-containing protein [Chondromyces apiculatus]|uniref:TonB C-terminal domain-containing protein n=1 Tax=Chondromyces apiculatus DSM 436 TaxID=1192034 RepID=A0A017SVU6_9BACT|nr:AgmX/PglI C-terminal domain-containing protein [Chondromyces apiculatus]EYF01088.1 Hypothetical protein CAP_8646 [Chondromyces apiculatus DSM 436]